MRIKVNDNVIIEDGLDLYKAEDVTQINLKEDLNIKDVTNWPVLYIIYSEDKKKIYVGQSINVIQRMQSHKSQKDIRNIENLKYFLIVYYKKSNLSVIWNLEDSMIRCAFAYASMFDKGEVEILNNDTGHSHDYYNKNKCDKDIVVSEIWEKLKEQGIVNKSFSEVEKTFMYKLSPLIELTENQEKIKAEALRLLKNKDDVLIQGIPGTGKTVLALNLARTLLNRNPENQIAIVTPVSSFCGTLKKVVQNIKSFSKIDIFTPNELVKEYYDKNRNFDYIIVDEAHRLKYCQNKGILSYSRNIVFWKLRQELIKYFSNEAFDKSNEIVDLINNFDKEPKVVETKKKKKDGSVICNKTLGKNEINEYLNKDNNIELFQSINQLDWIRVIGKKRIYLYDELQSIRSDDLKKKDLYNRLGKDVEYKILELEEPIRIKNKAYIKFLDNLLEIDLNSKNEINLKYLYNKTIKGENGYELYICNTFEEMENKLKEKKSYGSNCRLLSGDYKEWKSRKNKKNGKNEHDFCFIENKKRIYKDWNSVQIDWCNTKNAMDLKEIGCVHTIQGYDIDYAGVIIGEELKYDKGIKVVTKNYKDIAGKAGLTSKEKEEELLSYIKNIYRILLTRGIKGTYIYVCDEGLRNYLKKYIKNDFCNNEDNITDKKILDFVAEDYDDFTVN